MNKVVKKKSPAAEAPPPELPRDPRIRLLFRVGAAVAFLFSLGLYWRTMAPGATFWDAGEFIACAYTLGIPHSPGTPLYVLLGRVATLLPLPLSIAGKVNFINVLAGAGGVLFVYVLAVRFLDDMLGKSASIADAVLKVAAAMVGALFLAFSHTYWANTTESEVYALSSFFMGFMTWLGLKWSDNPSGERATTAVFLIFYLLALSVGLHLGTILAFVGIFLIILMTPGKRFTNTEFLLACFGVAIFVADATLYRNGTLTLVLLALYALAVVYAYTKTKSRFAPICTLLFILGISVHLYLYIRSAHNPLIDEADPETWRNLYAVLRREQYPPTNILARKATLLFQLQHFNGYFQEQFQMASAYIGRMNLGSVIPLGLGIWGMIDHWVKHRKTFIMLFATFVVTSLGLILYLNFSADEVRERDYFYLSAFYYFAIFIAIGAGSLIQEARRFVAGSKDSRLAHVVALSLIFLALPMFTLKHHYHMHDRSGDVVCREYAMNMLVGLEPNAVLFTNGDNDTFPLWYIQEVERYRTDVRVVNLSLLNTPWYIRQLRDNEPKLEIKWTTEEINNIRPVRTEQGWVLVRDLGVAHILKNVSSRRPIYFAVTIPPEIFSPYREILEMEGLAYRVVPRRGTNMVNLDRLEDNIWEKYSYKGLLDDNWKRDETVYQPPFVHRLVQNYAAAFTQLGFLRAQEGTPEAGVRNLEVALEISPDLNAALYWLGWYYFETGDTVRALEFYDEQIARRPDLVELHYRKAGIYERIGDYNSAVVELDEMLRRDAGNRDVLVTLVGMLIEIDEYDRATAYIDNWLLTHPNDRAVRSMREELDKRRSLPEEEPPGDGPP